MKKISLVILAICMIAGIANAQKMYFRLGVGGGAGLKQFDGYGWADQTRTTTSDNYVIKSMGLGGGFNANLAFGVMLSDYVGIELGINEFIGLTKKIHQSYTNSNTGYSSSDDQKVSGMMLQVIPAVVITPGLEKINPYARLGMIVGILPSIVEKYNSTSNDNVTLKATHSYTDKIKLSGGMALGFSMAGGVAFNLSEKLDLFSELVFNGITYAPRKGKYKEWTEDGVDQLATATTKEKEWIFVRKFDADENIPDGNPDKQAKMSLNFSNVELNIGIKLKL